MEIVFGWLLVALYLGLAAILMPDYAWLMGGLIAWAEARELFGGQAVGAIGLGVALTVAVVGWSEKLVRWIMHRRRSPLLVGQRTANATGRRR